MSDVRMELQNYFAKWDGLLKRPDWYVAIIPDLQAIKADIETIGILNQEALKDELYSFFDSRLAASKIPLGTNRGYFDRARKPIDTVVMHHTSHQPGFTPNQLSAVELVRLYMPYFAAPVEAEDKQLRGQAIFSGHVRDGRQVFWPYHWVVLTDGSCRRLLADSETGWHAGNWEVNCRSVAIVFDNDYENSAPSERELRAAAEIIKTHYANVSPDHILGHREINPKTTCPSNLFLLGWKQDLLKLLS